MRVFTIILCLFLSQIIFGQKQTIYIVRHGEKDLLDQDKRNPNLSKEGIERALALKDLLKNKNIEAAYSTPFKRTQQTIKPLVEFKKINIVEYTHILKLVEDVKKSKKNTIIAGHSNTILEINKAFGGENKLNEVNEDDYSNLIILTIKDDKIKSKFKKYHSK